MRKHTSPTDYCLTYILTLISIPKTIKIKFISSTNFLICMLNYALVASVSAKNAPADRKDTCLVRSNIFLF